MTTTLLIPVTDGFVLKSNWYFLSELSSDNRVLPKEVIGRCPLHPVGLDSFAINILVSGCCGYDGIWSDWEGSSFTGPLLNLSWLATPFDPATEYEHNRGEILRKGAAYCGCKHILTMSSPTFSNVTDYRGPWSWLFWPILEIIGFPLARIFSV